MKKWIIEYSVIISIAGLIILTVLWNMDFFINRIYYFVGGVVIAVFSLVSHSFREREEPGTVFFKADEFNQLSSCEDQKWHEYYLCACGRRERKKVYFAGPHNIDLDDVCPDCGLHKTNWRYQVGKMVNGQMEFRDDTRRGTEGKGRTNK